jgi:hypothetical protein
MSVAVGTALSADPAAWSIGPRKMEIQALAIVSGDITATVTATSLSRVDYCVVCVGSLTLTAAPTYSGAVVSLAFTDPAASRFGTITLYGV